MIILALLSYPLTFILKPTQRMPVSFTLKLLWCFIFLSALAPSILYIISQKVSYKDWLKRCIFIPTLMVIGCGIAFNNTRGVVEAIFNIKGDFIRTPKYGILKRKKTAAIKNYASSVNLNSLGEILLGIYCLAGFIQYLIHKEYILGYFLSTCAIGFFYIGIFSLIENVKQRKAVS